MAMTEPFMLGGAREYAIPYAVTLMKTSEKAVTAVGMAYSQRERGETPVPISQVEAA